MTNRALKDVSDVDTKLIQQFVKAVSDIDQVLHRLRYSMTQSALNVDTMLKVRNLKIDKVLLPQGYL